MNEGNCVEKTVVDIMSVHKFKNPINGCCSYTTASLRLNCTPRSSHVRTVSSESENCSHSVKLRFQYNMQRAYFSLGFISIHVLDKKSDHSSYRTGKMHALRARVRAHTHTHTYTHKHTRQKLSRQRVHTVCMVKLQTHPAVYNHLFTQLCGQALLCLRFTLK